MATMGELPSSGNFLFLPLNTEALQGPRKGREVPLELTPDGVSRPA